MCFSFGTIRSFFGMTTTNCQSCPCSRTFLGVGAKVICRCLVRIRGSAPISPANFSTEHFQFLLMLLSSASGSFHSPFHSRPLHFRLHIFSFLPLARFCSHAIENFPFRCRSSSR